MKYLEHIDIVVVLAFVGLLLHRITDDSKEKSPRKVKVIRGVLLIFALSALILQAINLYLKYS